MKKVITKRIIFAALAVVILSFFVLQLPTTDKAGNTVDWFNILQWLFVGLVVFLFGMGEMEFAMKAIAGNKMRSTLKSLTNNRIKGTFAGLFTTAIIQSSSVTTVMLISFVSAGLLSFSRAIPPIIGARIGTTITAQIISFNVTIIIPILLILGFAIMKILKSGQQQRMGRIFLGLGFIFWGMDIMTKAMEPLRTFQPFIDLMGNMENVVLAILVAALFTALVQSSSATIGVIIAFALQGLISLEVGIALTLGANIGTTVTAGLASIGKPRSALRVAVAHTSLSFFGVILFVGFIPQFASVVEAITAFTSSASASGNSSNMLAREVANAHTIFNVSVALIVLPFVGTVAKVIEKLVPEKKKIGSFKITKYLISEENIGDSPIAAIDGARLEIDRMGVKIDKMFKEVLPAIFSGDIDSLKNITEEDDMVDKLYKKIVKYLSKIRAQELSDELSQELDEVTAIARYIEQIGDIVETNLAPGGLVLAEKNIFISDKTQALMKDLHSLVHEILHLLLKANKVIAISENREEAIKKAQEVAKEIKDKRKEVEKVSQDVFARTESRLTKAYVVEADIIEALTRAYFLARSAAKIIVDREI